MSKYNIDNGKTAIVDKIKHHEKHNQTKKLKQTTATKRFMQIIRASIQLKCMSPGPISMWLSAFCLEEAVDEGGD